MAATTGGGASPGGGGGAALEEECEVVRVRVKKNEGQQPPEFRSFAVDPQITSLDVLQHILARAFDLQGKKSFVLSFAARDGQGQDTFVPLLSDGDLANAFTCARPTLRLRLDVRNPPDSPLLEDWDIISPREVAAAEPVPERRSLLAAALPFTQALLAQVGRTLARAQAALAWPEGTLAVSPPPPPPPPCAPLSDADLRSYLGPGGRLLRPQDLRLHIFHGGVEPGLRKVVWRYLLNVFPAGLTGQERLSHLRLKAAEYSSLKVALAARAAPAELAQVAAAVRKDVVRTDRAHPYFGGPEEGHPHLAALQALLTTFALGHPRLSYCQGMSDVAAPLLAVLDDEAQAFLCFCSLMRRLAPRFRPGGRGLARAFGHLRRLLRRADPQFWAFLAARGAHDLLFCYRWLLLELKREFAFEDALKVLEITWSSLPPAPPPPPEGVPLLGAPLGARRAGRGLRERRGLRPRPPRRRRRRRKAEEEGGGEGTGGITEGSAGGFGGLKGCCDGPEGPKSSSDVPGGPMSSGDVLGGPTSSSDGPEGPTSSSGSPGGLKTSSDGPEGPKSSRDVPSSPKISSEVFETPKSFSNVLEGSKGSQEGIQSSSDVPSSHKISSEVFKSPKSSSDVPDGPRDSQEGPESFKDIEEGLESSSNVPRGHKSSSDVPRGHKSSRKVQGRLPRDAGGAPEGSKDSEPGGGRGRKVEEGTDALEMEQRPHSFCWGAGEDPKKGQGGPKEGHHPGEGQDDHRKGQGDPKEGFDDPKEELDDPREGGDDPGTNRDDLRKVPDDLREGHGFGEGHNNPRDGRGDLKDGCDDLKDGHDDLKNGRDAPKEGCDDPRRGHHDLKHDHHDPKDSHDDTNHDHHHLHDDHHTPKTTRHNPTTPEDPWGGRWAWEDPSSSSSSSSSTSCSSGSSSDEEVTVEDDGAPLPPPEELGQGNPFLLFVCLAMLLEQREAVMARAGDYNEVAMHFDRLVRRHHLPRVLRRAKALFARYLEGWGATAPGGPQTGPPSG
ncbi:TBC1 domain family member 25 [Haemorhous mexicanus]|uniref:TBC1 domain family member 25 n=1 Tax=Haemorhous mexicanus TaxID=30427 RepID=UPI0028BE8C26|nr:TBC1 domain family member 25 [Haemorhous mexicanus]XP_059728415.1 TBC1 domain family member 25 [Haemorhous mexicanus]XP_059728416.1 TBC1 domain family member 25 [Haemorhous mexicanus]XP_059728417.1 TBC1 domain family member 25 [Haemorhous mexicanus]XP_059728418.1 TBC1 domain family member 25 [Haemorhous mexicanus]XP_059728419.1 TBC1 domain family member 25 [Haemorhous mexicanus]XP_059728420.1 TBC1 domain family member 25 [Haemorhous mexicanus]XP_059728421.1 TBC1 domain family member 25 [H